MNTTSSGDSVSCVAQSDFVLPSLHSTQLPLNLEVVTFPTPHD